MIRIFLVDDQTMLCKLLQSWLQGEEDFEVVGYANDGQSAIEQVEALQPDIVLIDIEMPGMNGVTATKIINQSFPEVKVIILSGYDDDTYVANALRSGAKGYLLKNTNPQELVETIRSVNRGYSQVGPGLFEKVAAQISILKPDRSQLNQSSLPNSELQFLLKGFEPEALTKFVDLVVTNGTTIEILAYLDSYLKNNPTNIAALYLAGILNARTQTNISLAFQFLQSGFREATEQRLPWDSLWLFYQAGARLKPLDAFHWLIQSNTVWDSQDSLSFLLQEAALFSTQNSSQAQTLATLAKIKALKAISHSLTAYTSKLENLQQGFKRLEQKAITL